jgi:hypothetical protein
MASPVVYQEAFNNKLVELLNDMITTFPDICEDLKTLKHGVNMIRNIDPKVPQSFFNERVCVPYEERILSKDENFFLDHDYTDDVKLIHGFNIDVVGKLKSIWKDMNEGNKQTIWKYMHVLLALNRKCVNV